MVAHDFDPFTLKAEADGSLRTQGQTVLCTVSSRTAIAISLLCMEYILLLEKKEGDFLFLFLKLGFLSVTALAIAELHVDQAGL